MERLAFDSLLARIREDFHLDFLSVSFLSKSPSLLLGLAPGSLKGCSLCWQENVPAVCIHRGLHQQKPTEFSACWRPDSCLRLSDASFLAKYWLLFIYFDLVTIRCIWIIILFFELEIPLRVALCASLTNIILIISFFKAINENII